MPTFQYSSDSTDPMEVPFEEGESVLTALTRSGIHPGNGGCLCFAGDCAHCLTSVDGVAYMRSCQVAADTATTVVAHPSNGYPEVPTDGGTQPAGITYETTDLIIIGAGQSGRNAANGATGRETLVLDSEAGHDVIGIYAGPMVIARSATRMTHIACNEIIVATGASEIQPACPGSDLIGIITTRAADHLHDAGIDLGACVVFGTPPSFDATVVEGELVRFEGTTRVEAVVTRTEAGEQRHPCDTAIVGLGLYPRDGLGRMAAGLPATIVGDAGLTPTLPSCPPEGIVCPCNGVSFEDLESVWQRGFHEMELLKRSTLAGTGTCQGAACLPYLQRFLQDHGSTQSAPFTARPVAKQITLGEAAAGEHLQAVPRTPLDGVHRSLGAQMDRIGGWWRPWSYGSLGTEYNAVRSAVSLGDVSTLGKMTVTGPDADAFLQYIYPTDITTIRPGRARYVLMLNEGGYVFDDGLVARELDGRFSLTFTSGGASHAEMWLRDWGSRFDIRMFNSTVSTGAVNVTGPRATELLARAGFTEPLPFMRHTNATVAGVTCKVYRLSFTGEASYELHHPADQSRQLWSALMDMGADMDIAPHGLEALQLLRLEKGHILVGADTTFDSTPRRIHHDWAVNLNCGDFLGRDSIIRTNDIPLDRMLVGLVSDHEPIQGALMYAGDTYAGQVTSVGWSPTLGKAVILADMDYIHGELPETVLIEGQAAHRVPLPFYDADGGRARA